MLKNKLFDENHADYWREERRIYAMSRFFKPSMVSNMSVRDLKDGLEEMCEVLPFINLHKDEMFDGIIDYHEYCSNCNERGDSHETFRNNLQGSWREPLRKYLTVQVSSASAERLFSLLRAAIGERQVKVLADWVRLVCIQHSLNKNREWMYKRNILEDVPNDWNAHMNELESIIEQEEEEWNEDEEEDD